ncbi:MAG: hypothetical protein JXR07_09695 [Reichenbachiella sp.]
MKKITTMLMSLCLLVSTVSYAQDDEIPTKDITNVNIKGFGGVKSIYDKNTNMVVGHYMYYNNGSFLNVKFLDLDLNITAELPFSVGTGDIQEAIYNGETIIFSTINNPVVDSNMGTWTAQIQYMAVDLEGKVTGYTGTDFPATKDGKTQPFIVPSEYDNGFYLVTPARKGAVFGFVGYEIKKVDSYLKEQWKKSFFPEKKKEGIMLQKAVSGFDRLIIVESKMASWITNKMTGTELVCFDGNNGDELYRAAMYADKFNSMPSQIVVNEDGEIGLGGEFFKGLKTKNTGSEGVFVSRLDASGNEISQNRVTWKDGIQKQLKRGNFSLSGKNKVVFHDILASEDGGFSLIGESFSKKQTLGEGSALGIAAKIAAQAAGLDPDLAEKATQLVDLKNVIIALATGKYIGDPFDNYYLGNLFAPENVRTPTIMTIQDLMIFDFDEALELQEVRKVEKPYTKVYSYPPYSGVGGLTLAKIMKGSGFFDYSFVQADPESGKQMMIYNSMMSKRPNIGIVDIEKGSEAIPQQYVVKNLRKYGGFDEESEGDKAGSKDEDGKKMKFSNTGIAKSNDGKVVIYYIEKKKKERTGTLKMWHETIKAGTE